MAEDESAYTVDPDLYESDAGLGRSAVYYEEAGVRKAYPETNALSSCEACGTRVIIGALEDGTRVTVEPEALTYVLHWRQRAQRKGAPKLPTLTQSRGYPAHRCREAG